MQALTFNNYVFDAQQVFRQLMHAMSFPGRIHALEDNLMIKTGVLPPAAAAIALTIFDNDSSVWLAPEYDECRDWLVSQTGCHLAVSRKAHFVMLKARNFGVLDDYCQGQPNYPDLSTTVIMNDVRLGQGVRYSASGPGIDSQIEIAMAGLPSDFMELWTDNHARYPLGIDLILTDKAKIVALPRTTRLQKEL